MTRQLLVLLSFICLRHFCSAQDIKPVTTPTESTPKTKTKKEKKATPSFEVKLQANHDFYFVLNKNKPQKVLKGDQQTISLNERVHTLVFEEADSTGERLEQYLKVTKEMMQRDTLISINFKNDYPEIVQGYSAVAPIKTSQQQRR